MGTLDVSTWASFFSRFPKSACFAAVVVAIAFNGLISFQVYSHNLFYAFTSGTNDVA